MIDSGRVIRLIPLALIAVVVAVGVLLAVRDEAGAPERSEPVAIEAIGPVFATADDMAAASDLVVDATVTDVQEGRVVTDSGDADRGIRTRLVELTVESTLWGVAPDVVLVEQEAALLDGTPIIVNGVAPFVLGERAIWFLVRDPTGETDWFAVINEQGRVSVP